MYSGRSRPLIIVYLLLIAALLAPNLFAVIPMMVGVSDEIVPPAEGNQTDFQLGSNVITLEPGTINPEIVQVTIGESVTFLNNDVQSRRLRFEAENPGGDHFVYLPLIARSTSSTLNAQSDTDSQAEEIITIDPGESYDLLLDTIGNIVAEDADQSDLSTTILWFPKPCPPVGQSSAR